jgi:PAS domain S-box-containing protein
MPTKAELEQKVADLEAQLAQSEKKNADDLILRLTAIVNTTTDFVSTSDMDGHIIYTNPEGMRLVGREGTDPTDLEISDFHSDTWARRIGEDYIPVVMEEGIWTGELQLQHADGTEFPVSGVITRIENKAGEPIGFGALYRDIREPKKVQAELDEQRRILQALLDNMPVGAFMVEAPSGVPVLANRRAGELLGKGIMPGAGKDNLAEVYDAYLYGTDEIYPTERLPIVRAMQGEASYVDDMEVRRPDGENILLEVYGIPVTNQEGEVIWSLITFQDITERKETETELQLFATAVEQAGDGIALVTPEGNILYANPAIAEMHGYTLEELEDGNLVMFHTPEQMQKEAIPAVQSVVETGTYEGEMGHATKNGTTFPTSMSVTMLHDEDGSPIGMLATVHDITELKEAEAERERLHQEIIEAQQRAIQELSTPVIPVMDRIIVMPLVGSIDSMRAKDIMRTLLQGIREHKAKIVILDITGVPIMDSGVANHLNKTIQAARLKGAHTIVTGVSDAVAETIIDLGIDWDQVETLGELQTGLLYALNRLGVELNRR